MGRVKMNVRNNVIYRTGCIHLTDMPEAHNYRPAVALVPL